MEPVSPGGDATEEERARVVAVELGAETILGARSLCGVDRTSREGRPRPLRRGCLSGLVVSGDGEGARIGLIASGPGGEGV